MHIEQDYIMKMIHQLIEVLLGYIFKGKEKGLEENINKSQEQTEKYDKLKILVDNYEINQAENLLFANIDINNIEDLKLALLFYQYVNEKDNEFLEKSNYSREEIEQGIKDISKKYGYENIVNLFFM
jgi:hypothetical protein